MPLIRRASTSLLALLTLLLLVWPALINRYPLLFPDTLDYLGEGRSALYALLHAHHPAFGGMRSAIYSLGIYAFHLNRTPWPILVLHAAIVACTVYLTVRSIRAHNALTNTLLILAALSFLTSLSWYISLLMPDILGGPLYLAIYLLAFARPTLSRTEQGIVAALAIFCATAHSTHLLIAIVLCVLLTTLQLLTLCTSPWRTSAHFAPFASRPLSLALATSTIAVAILLQFTVNARLFGHASLGGNRPPYLEARLVADGPGRLFLQQHCAHLNWLLCRNVAQLPTNDDAFLWDDHGIWPSATPGEQLELRREELPLALATLRAYPRQQLAVSAANAWQQLTGFGLDDFDSNAYMQSNLNTVIPNGRAAFDRTLQAHDATPWHPFTIAQNLTVLASLLATLALLPQTISRRNTRLLGLVTIILTAVILNAILTGVLSEVDSRYQARIVWLIPLLASQLLLARKKVPAPEEAGNKATQGSARTADEIPADLTPA
jgi:hypothetical protein